MNQLRHGCRATFLLTHTSKLWSEVEKYLRWKHSNTTEHSWELPYTKSSVSCFSWEFLDIKWAQILHQIDVWHEWLICYGLWRVWTQALTSLLLRIWMFLMYLIVVFLDSSGLSSFLDVYQDPLKHQVVTETQRKIEMHWLSVLILCSLTRKMSQYRRDPIRRDPIQSDVSLVDVVLIMNRHQMTMITKDYIVLLWLDRIFNKNCAWRVT